MVTLHKRLSVTVVTGFIDHSIVITIGSVLWVVNSIIATNKII